MLSSSLMNQKAMQKWITIIEKALYKIARVDRFKVWSVARAPDSEQHNKNEGEEMIFHLADYEQCGLKPPVSVQISRCYPAAQLFGFTSLVFRNTEKHEFNIPMDAETFTRTQFRLFVQTSWGWSAAPGKDLSGTAFYRVYSAYAAGWARIFVLPVVTSSDLEWTVSVRVLTITVDAMPSDLDLRDFHQVSSLFRSKKIAGCTKFMPKEG